MSEHYDLIIVGAGPSGLACAIEAQKQGLSYLVIEKGGITDAIRRFPVDMTFFSTADLLEIGEIPFTVTQMRPSRVECLEYYRRVVQHFKLNLSLHNKLLQVNKNEFGTFNVKTEKAIFSSTYFIFATGYFDYTNKLNVPGEDLPHVKHYYDEPHAYSGMDVVVIGGRNSAVETALELYRHGVRVTLVHRKNDLGKSVKYWVEPDIRNRIKEGAIATRFSSVVTRIENGKLQVRNKEGEEETLAADFVFPLIGYRPDEALLRSAGVELNEELIPSYDEETFETNISGLYIAGSVACGNQTWNIFIENGRAHAKPLISHILKVHRPKAIL
ncbi:MAG: YpdA family putative bacillithiol disulfide reductase [Lentisphaeria bacterium]|nr:YpdA family putative bacillithiol disulfide reductase [Lentisphaeria bacterium]